LCDVSISGDEAMIYAHKLSNAIVIVSEDRPTGIQKAKEMGAKIVFLDDAYSKHDIKKLDLLIDVETKNNRCLPSGAFRERLWSSKEAILIEEEKDFSRVVELKNKSAKMSLVTAIARPSRLDEFLPEVVSKNYFEDHHSYTKLELEEILEKDNSDSLLLTYKDYVKVESFNLPISLLDLDVQVDENIFSRIDNYRDKH
jgi:tetraacyldisaccharide 4'-kinase